MKLRRPAVGRSVDERRQKHEMPEDYGHHTRRCQICDAFLCRYNAEPICFVHQPQGKKEEGVLIEVTQGVYRRFVLAPRERVTDDLWELMEAAP